MLCGQACCLLPMKRWSVRATYIMLHISYIRHMYHMPIHPCSLHTFRLHGSTPISALAWTVRTKNIPSCLQAGQAWMSCVLPYINLLRQ